VKWTHTFGDAVMNISRLSKLLPIRCVFRDPSSVLADPIDPDDIGVQRKTQWPDWAGAKGVWLKLHREQGRKGARMEGK